MINHQYQGEEGCECKDKFNKFVQCKCVSFTVIRKKKDGVDPEGHVVRYCTDTDIASHHLCLPQTLCMNSTCNKLLQSGRHF